MKKNRSHQWISIADLMSGVLAVTMLMLVVSVLQSEVNRFMREQAYEKELATLRDKDIDVIQKVLSSIELIAKQDDVSRLFKFDANAAKFILADGTFARGSACITPAMQDALNKVAEQIAIFLRNDAGNQIFIEGHTDSVSVKGPVTDYVKNCTVYDDNYTLSASRAREARNLFLSILSENEKKRIIVAGYGDSVPALPSDTTDPVNRRVEIRLVNSSLNVN